MTLRDLFTPLALVLALALAAATLAGFVLVPAGTILPVHWGISGQADGFLPRDAALLLLPGIFVLVIALIWLSTRLNAPERVAGARHGLRVVVPGLLALCLVIQAATILIGMGQPVDMVRIIVLALGLLFVLLGNVLPKSQPNAVSGVRLPWTMASPANWQATNRLVGLLMLLAGLAMAIAALLTSSPYALLAVVTAGVLIPLLAGTLYSYRLSRR
ncbi:SdpI family protein [Devosia sp.]|uniref:SdpI family protein n=1 Tax=Devosia sp. TaxID=1871048 RepID=UPI002FCAA12D